MTAEKVALITGVTGQDGAYLAELLLSKGYVVHGLKRRSSSFNTGRVDHLYVDPHEAHAKFFMHHGDLTDATNLIRIVQETQPTEIYNLAAQSHVQVSFETPEYTANADGLGTLRLLEAIRILDRADKTRFYQASTSELYGLVQETPQRETTPFYPRSPYAAAKLYAYWITVNYREAYNFHASNGILFNHEGPTRGETFVTRKITRAVAAIHLGTQETLYIGMQRVKELDPSMFTKSGIMVGLGEDRQSVIQVMEDMRAADIDFLTIGQYLQPTPKHHRVDRFVTPEEFASYEKAAYGKGFLMVSATPLTRSSYHAGDDFARLRAARQARLA